MTLRGCSIDNQINLSLEFPTCVILTHRHGACLGIFANESNISSVCSSQLDFPIEKCENFEFFKEKNAFVCARVLGKTAENLARLFQFATWKLNLMGIKTFIVGTGPGSFTGLRLGCAFVNGIHLGANVVLYRVNTEPVYDLSEFVTFADLRNALQKIVQGDIAKCDSLSPDYNKILS